MPWTTWVLHTTSPRVFTNLQVLTKMAEGATVLYSSPQINFSTQVNSSNIFLQTLYLLSRFTQLLKKKAPLFPRCLCFGTWSTVEFPSSSPPWLMTGTIVTRKIQYNGTCKMPSIWFWQHYEQGRTPGEQFGFPKVHTKDEEVPNQTRYFCPQQGSGGGGGENLILQCKQQWWLNCVYF